MFRTERALILFLTFWTCSSNSLHDAVKRNDMKAVAKLTNKWNRIWLKPNAKNEAGQTALFIAASKGNERMLTRLLKAKCDVNISDDNKETALHAAAARGFTRICEILIEAKARINVVNNFGKTPLFLAVANGKYKTAATLLDLGAYVETKDFFGITVLFEAVRRNNVRMVDLLLGRGANANAKQFIDRPMLETYFMTTKSCNVDIALRLIEHCPITSRTVRRLCALYPFQYVLQKCAFLPRNVDFRRFWSKFYKTYRTVKNLASDSDGVKTGLQTLHWRLLDHDSNKISIVYEVARRYFPIWSAKRQLMAIPEGGLEDEQWSSFSNQQEDIYKVKKREAKESVKAFELERDFSYFQSILKETVFREKFRQSGLFDKFPFDVGILIWNKTSMAGIYDLPTRRLAISFGLLMENVTIQRKDYFHDEIRAKDTLRYIMRVCHDAVVKGSRNKF